MALTKVLADQMHRWPQIESAYFTDPQVKYQIDLLSEYIDITRDVLAGQSWAVPLDLVEYLTQQVAVRVLMTGNAGAESAEVQRRLLSTLTTKPAADPLGGA